MSAAAPPVGGPRILVIDDEEGIRQGCVRALGLQGYQVETAGTMAEGRRQIELAHFDLVLLDVMLPDGQGTALLKTIYARDPETVAVIITGFATVELAVEAIKQGAYDFISKPFDTDLLLLTVNQGLEKRRLSLETLRLQTVERETARLERDKQEMERLDQFKSAFMLTVAHELRSPVAAAQSLLRTMLRGLAGELNDQQREVLRRVEVRHGQLLELINDLLSLAASKTYDPGQPLQPVSLSQAVRLVMEAFAPQAQEKGVRIAPLDLPTDLLVQASEDGLNKVLANLVGNAVKYTPSGGQVTVGVRREGNSAEVAVTDSGIGISAEELPRLGTEFFRAQSAKQAEIPGTGLGLSIVREQLRRFGGSLEITSTPGKGSTFSARLPLVAR
jgi:signal transduction histidine kinase